MMCLNLKGAILDNFFCHIKRFPSPCMQIMLFESSNVLKRKCYICVRHFLFEKSVLKGNARMAHIFLWTDDSQWPSTKKGIQHWSLLTTRNPPVGIEKNISRMFPLFDRRWLPEGRFSSQKNHPFPFWSRKNIPWMESTPLPPFRLSTGNRPPCALTTRWSDCNFLEPSPRKPIESPACLLTIRWPDRNFFLGKWPVSGQIFF